MTLFFGSRGLCKDVPSLKKIEERVSILDIFIGWGVCRQAKEVVKIKLSLFVCHSKTVVNVGTISLECLDNQPIKISTRFSGSDVTGQH